MANFFLAFLLYSQGNCGILRNETRLVVMPELQGRGIGPKMTEIQGDGIGPKIQGYLWCTTESVRQFLGDEYINRDSKLPFRACKTPKLIVCIEQKRNWRTSNPGKDCKGWVNLAGLIWMLRNSKNCELPKKLARSFLLDGSYCLQVHSPCSETPL